ncbi:MAG: alpha-2-macroglobulin family protein [Deltaproteobacteria bacterium]|nr:alpha-2-macroglobulin family protein [Deltaproteobacteria bacterium]
MTTNCEIRPISQKMKFCLRTASRLTMGLALLGLILSLSGSTASGAGPVRPEKDAAAYNPEKNFTIKEVIPSPEKEVVKIIFSAPVPLEMIRGNLRFLPRLKLDWDGSTMSPEGVLTLKGAFRYGSPHYIDLPETLEVKGKTYFPTVTRFAMPDRLARVEFVEGKRVIERDSRQLLHVRTVNVKEVFLESLRVPPVLLPQALAAAGAGQDLGQTLEQLKAAVVELEPLIKGNRAYSPFMGQPGQENQLFPAGGEKNQLKAVSLPLSFRSHKEKGSLELIRVKDNSPGSLTTTETGLFRLTDLGLTYKLGQHQLLLWLSSLKTGTPVGGAQVLAFTRQSEVFPLGVTGQDGVLLIDSRERDGLSLNQPGAFKPAKRPVDIKDITFLMAGADGDVSFIEVEPEGGVKPQGIRQVTGDYIPRNLKGQVFTERGVYRPGEKVFFKGTVREYREGAVKSPQGLPVTFRVTNSKGEEVFKVADKLSDFGTASGEMATEPHWAVGAYTLTMSFGAETEASIGAPKDEEEEPEYDDNGRKVIKPKAGEATITFQVQEFKPPRHFTEIAFERIKRTDTRYVNRERQAEFVKIVISGGYYVGGVVKHGQVRWKIHQSRTEYQVPGYDGYTFGCDGKEQGELIESGQAILDEKGQAAVEFPLDKNLVSGRQGLYVVATVVDFDGRAATAAKQFQADPEFLVGISRHPEKIQMGEPQNLKIVVVDGQGRKVRRGSLQIEVLQESWTYVAKRNDQGDLYWDDATIWKKALAADVPLKRGEGVFRFDCAQGGRYLLAFVYKDDKGRTFTSSTPYKVAWEYRVDEKRSRPYELLGLWADRSAYKPGDTADITLSPKTPISWYLVTVERDGILDYQVVQGGQESKTLPLAIKGDYPPNVYVSVLGLTPRGDFPVHTGRYDSEAPGFVWGTLNLAVLKEPEGLEVKISLAAPELKAEPGVPVSVDFLVTDPQGKGVEAEMAVAVVDESVLALTGFKTPALEQLTRFDLPLRVFTGELRQALVHQTPFYPSQIEPLTGGGGMSGEMLSKLRKLFKAVAYYNPAVRTDARGKARISFTLPDNIASYRVYAVALDRGSRFANAERRLIAAKDFYLEPGLPNYFIRGDSFRFQVAAFNTSQAKGPVEFSAAAQGGLKLSADDKGRLEPQGSAKLNVSGTAEAAGPAKVRFAGRFWDKDDEVELNLKINSGLVRDTYSSFGSFTGSGEARLVLPAYLTGAGADKVNPEEVQAVLTLSGSPFARLARPLGYLLHYPYGCVEQTSSGVLGLAALRGLIRDGHISGVAPEEVDRFIKSGIDRLFAMQTRQGEFVYWPGHRYPHPWGTIYAVAALSVAKTQGLAVWAEGLNKSLEALRSKFYGEVSSTQKAFACYLLALNKSLDRDSYLRVKRDEARMTREGKLLMLLAAKHAGLQSPDELKTGLKGVLKAKEEMPAQSWQEDFDAHYRGPALELLATRSIMPDDPVTGKAAQKLLGGLGNNGRWTSTSDTGWALLALGEYFTGVTFSQEAGDVSVTQPQGPTQSLTLDPKGSRSLNLDARAFLRNPVIKLKGQPGRTWLYQVDFTAPRLDLVEKGAEQGFKVTKNVKNTDGTNTIKVGDLVKVSLMVDVTKTQKYVVLDDPVPAGLMAVNTAFKTEETIPPDQEQEQEEDFFDYFAPDGTMRFRPNFFEIRDDRVLAFRDLVFAGSYRFVYYARAVCEGSFIMPSTQAAAMYDPEAKGFSPQGRLTVQAR